MDTNSIIAESVAAFKQTLEAVCEKAAGKPLSADNFSEFIGGMSEAVSRAALRVDSRTVFLHQSPSRVIAEDRNPPRKECGNARPDPVFL